MNNPFSFRSWFWQVLGFGLGAWLFWTVLRGAIQAGDFSAFREADPMLLGLMFLLSLVSSVCNAALFTSVSRPLGHHPPLSLRRMVPLNFSCGALNYAPFRLGGRTNRMACACGWHECGTRPALMAMAGGWYLVGLAAFERCGFGLRPIGDIGPRVAVASGRLGPGRIVIAKLPEGCSARPVPC